MKHLCIFLLVWSASAHAQHPIGRLFTTPQERQQLDIGRGLLPAPAPVSAVAPAPPAPLPAPLTVNGFVRRSSGTSTVWIDQQPQELGRAPVGGKSGVSVTLPSGRKVMVKPGQSIDLNDGTVSEAGPR